MTLKALMLGSAMILGGAGVAHAGYGTNDGCPAGNGALTLTDNSGNTETVCVSNTSPVSFNLTTLSYLVGFNIVTHQSYYQTWSGHIHEASVSGSDPHHFLRVIFYGGSIGGQACTPTEMDEASDQAGDLCITTATSMTLQNVNN